MLIKEYRIVMPLTTAEFKIGQLYTTIEASKLETGGGEGIEVLIDEPFMDVPLYGGRYTSGNYTKKLYHIEEKVPKKFRYFTPKSSMQFIEEAWNAFPYCKTEITNPSFFKQLNILIESMHIDGTDVGDNLLNLSPEDLKKREVVEIDILNDASGHIHKNYDPSTYVLIKKNRGPLTEDWKTTVKPLMTCVKLVCIQFKYFGFQSYVENVLQKVERMIFLKFSRQVWCMSNDWIDLTLDQVRKLEIEGKKDLDVLRAAGNVRYHSELASDATIKRK